MAAAAASMESEPASPCARLMQSPSFNLSIIGVYGFATSIDLPAFKKGLRHTLLKHPRFSSLLVSSNNGANSRWERTDVDLERHVVCPDLNPDMESPDRFVEDYVSSMSSTAMDLSKPLWELHILNVKTSDADSTAVFKVHHSMGDGVSMISLLLACATKTSDPESLPALPLKKHKPVETRPLMKQFFVVLWTMVLVAFNTLIDSALLLATLMFYKDTETMIRAAPGTESSSHKRFLHRILDLNEVKLVKNAMNVSINDVVLGVTEAGLSRYLNKRYGELFSTPFCREDNTTDPKIGKKWTTFLPKNILLRSAVVFNLRPSATVKDLAELMANENGLKGMWGNLLGVVLLPHTIALHDDPLNYVRTAKATMDRKKLSLESKCAFIVMKLLVFLFGSKVAGSVTRAIFNNTTFTFSNVVGPGEEISLFGHPVAYIAPSVHGFPQALVIHYQSYGEKLVLALCADEKLIPDPHQLCDDLVKSLENIKEAAIKKGPVKE